MLYGPLGAKGVGLENRLSTFLPHPSFLGFLPAASSVRLLQAISWNYTKKFHQSRSFRGVNSKVPLVKVHVWWVPDPLDHSEIRVPGVLSQDPCSDQC